MAPAQPLTLPHPARARILAGVAGLALGATGVGAIVTTAASAATAPSLTVSRTTGLDPVASTTVTVRGSGYLVPPHAEGAEIFGGVYLFFGWVEPGGSWGPSNRNGSNNNGLFGETYAYPGDGGDGGTRDDNDGQIRLVSFTPGGISADATPYHMDDEGNWSAPLTIHGSTFTYADPAGGMHKVDCLRVRCGVFTIGAHGKASRTNEVFTPVTFKSPPVPTKTAEPPVTPTNKPRPSQESPSRTTEPTTEPTQIPQSPEPAVTASPSPVPTESPSRVTSTPNSPRATTDPTRAQPTRSPTSGPATGTTTMPSSPVSQNTTPPTVATEQVVAASSVSASGGSTGGILLGMVIVLALAAAGAAGWFWQRQRRAR